MLGGIGGKRRRERQRMRWHHSLDECESVLTLGDGDGQGGLACWNSWGRKESDTTERLNGTDEIPRILKFIESESTLSLSLGK